ncbi:NAD(P)/FAD-dependent oxidoreductase [Vibrio hannami]|uniref:NAD(P)/FAD-dependent oxidoreductase n=1 Tax=Vibrio hannami TaxID=2717094 RepID=UPI00241084E1|nr:NAD(P)/FAD-dependent oxidoreductase [Vibrio hannami]MDG3085556.1 NAD(P)/FAD-dependent oxidoreductase [Vibrio hannami]
MKGAHSKLFESVQLGRLKLKNRIAMSPMQPRFVEGTHQDATFSKWYVDYFKERAKGGVGLIITGQIKAEKNIDPYPTNACFPVLDSEEKVKEFAELTEVVHRYGTKIIAQLSAGAGRLADYPREEQWPAAPSELSMFYNPDLKTRSLELDEIKGLIAAFGKAAGKVKQAGFDGLYFHADAYLIDQFISSCWNQRTDEYGGSFENRMRFFDECFTAAKAAVGDDFPIFVGLALDHGFEGGRKMDETLQIARYMESKYHIDAFHMRNGCYDGFSSLSPNAHYPDGTVVDNAKIFRKEIKTPIIIDGKFGEPDLTTEVVESGLTDVVGMARALLSDPEWPNKVRQGRVEEIRPCIRCMECFDRVLKGKYMGCSVNAKVGQERSLPVMPAIAQKDVLVIGAGPAGMEAARIAAQRGHRVTIADKAQKLGGRLNEAAAPDYKYLVGKFKDWQANAMSKMDIEIKIGIDIDAAYVEQHNPDTVVLATGAKPFVPKIEGIEKAFHGVDILNEKVTVTGKTVVIGGGLVGCETAYFLAKRGVEVEIVELRDDIVTDVSVFNRFEMIGELEALNVKVHTDSMVSKVAGEGIVVVSAGEEKVLNADSIVLAAGFIPDDELYFDIQSMVDEVYLIGDATKARKIYDAVHDGYEIGKEI